MCVYIYICVCVCLCLCVCVCVCVCNRVNIVKDVGRALGNLSVLYPNISYKYSTEGP